MSVVAPARARDCPAPPIPVLDSDAELDAELGAELGAELDAELDAYLCTRPV